MSQGQPVPLERARGIAIDLTAHLAASCKRVEIAGSIRRRKAEVRDVEIVAIPLVSQVSTGGLFTDETVDYDELEGRLAELLASGRLAPRNVEIHRKDGSIESGQKLGPAYKALVWQGLPVDLFITDADRWGCIFALRTGPGDWNTKLVTDCQRYFRRVEGGRVLHLGRPVETREEADFFAAIGQPWVDPWERSVERVDVRRQA